MCPKFSLRIQARKTLRDGKDFVEIVGFMMDGMDLGRNENQRGRSTMFLHKISV